MLAYYDCKRHFIRLMLIHNLIFFIFSFSLGLGFDIMTQRRVRNCREKKVSTAKYTKIANTDYKQLL
jgi:uncharacterized membrane protein YeiB